MTSPSASSSTTPLLALALALVGLAVVGGIVGRRSPVEGAPAALTRSSPPPPSLPPPPLPTLEELAEAQAEGRGLGQDPDAEASGREAAAHEFYSGDVSVQGGGLTVTDEDGVVILRVSPEDLRTAQVVEDPFAPTSNKRCLVLADGARVVLPPDLGRGVLPRAVEYDRPPPDGDAPPE